MIIFLQKWLGLHSIKFLNESRLNETEKKYVDYLRKWNMRNDINEKGASVFRAIWDSLEVAVWADEFKNAKLLITMA